jgi:aminopeptidase-like protein
VRRLIEDLYPITRSITGDGVRATLARIGKEIALEVHEVPSGTAVLDWTVPDEWNLRRATITDVRSGAVLVDTDVHNLHVVNYSEPVAAQRFTLDELRPRLFTLPDRPSLIPYRTSYYNRTWGFCLTNDQLATVETNDDGGAHYEIVVDTTLEPGNLTYAEHVVAGTDDAAGEILVSTHVCHPSLANDNLSGIAAAVTLAARFQAAPLRHTVRFVFVPGTIGAITWLARNRATAVPRIRCGLVLTGLGDAGHLTYKRSQREDTVVDRAAALVLRESGHDHEIRAWSPYGYDERQYCSPGFDLAVGRLTRSPHGEFPEYHTSADDLSFLHDDQLATAVDVIDAILRTVNGDEALRSTQPFGEVQLGRRGLYRALGGANKPADTEFAMLWVLNQSNGSRSLLDIAERSGLAFAAVRAAADLLLDHGLLERTPPA